MSVIRISPPQLRTKNDEGHRSATFPPTFAAALAIGTVTALLWLYFDNTKGSVVRPEASALEAQWVALGVCVALLVNDKALANALEDTLP